MVRYVAKRFGYALLVVWAAYTVTFLLLYQLPSDPVSIMLNGGGNEVASSASDAQRRALEHAYGFDLPLVGQYFLLLGRLLTGDLGQSVTSHVSVTSLVAQALPSTLAIAGLRRT